MNRLAAASALVMLASCGKKADSAHMSHARELLSVQEWTSARTELKIELKDHPDNQEARGLLLFCLEKVGADGKGTDLSDLVDLDSVAIAVTSPEWAHVPNELRDQVNKELVSTRQSLFDKGIDTKDAVDLAAVVKSAATYCFAHDDVTDDKSACAAILAGVGDQNAAKYLIEQLKSQKPDAVVAYLVEVGDRAIPFLKKAIADPNFIGRTAALDALAQLEAASIGRQFTLDHPGVSDRDPSVAGDDMLESSYVRSNWRSRIRAHEEFAKFESGDGVLLVEGWSPQQKTEIVEMYGFRSGEMRRVGVTSQGKLIDLSGQSAVFALKAANDGVVFSRYQVKDRSIEVDTGKVAEPAIGMKVRLKGYEPHGTIAHATDDGMWIVHMDQPIEGMPDLTVPASSMIGLRSELSPLRSQETDTAKLVGQELQITRANLELDAMAKMLSFKDDMCKCTDSACAQQVADQMTTWGQAQAKDNRAPPKMTEAETRQFTNIGEAMGKCMRRAMSGGDR